MKLYIEHCETCRNKIPLDVYVETRAQFRYRYGESFTVQCPNCRRTNFYSPSEVKAESNTNSTVGGGVVGGLLGLLGGPVGLVIGASIGGAIGNGSDNEDRDRVHRFNTSH